jgi:hypothetical protein
MIEKRVAAGGTAERLGPVRPRRHYGRRTRRKKLGKVRLEAQPERASTPPILLVPFSRFVLRGTRFVSGICRC